MNSHTCRSQTFDEFSTAKPKNVFIDTQRVFTNLNWLGMFDILRSGRHLVTRFGHVYFCVCVFFKFYQNSEIPNRARQHFRSYHHHHRRPHFQ